MVDDVQQLDIILSFIKGDLDINDQKIRQSDLLELTCLLGCRKVFIDLLQAMDQVTMSMADDTYNLMIYLRQSDDDRQTFNIRMPEIRTYFTDSDWRKGKTIPMAPFNWNRRINLLKENLPNSR